MYSMRIKEQIIHHYTYSQVNSAPEYTTNPLILSLNLNEYAYVVILGILYIQSHGQYSLFSCPHIVFHVCMYT
jgi:hypothetical protein